MEETKSVHILEMPAWLNLECGVLLVESISTVKIVSFHKSSTKLCMHENCVIVLPVLMVWCATFEI